MINKSKIVPFKEGEFISEFCNEEGVLSSYPIDESLIRAFGIRYKDIKPYLEDGKDEDENGKAKSSFIILSEILAEKGILV